MNCAAELHDSELLSIDEGKPGGVTLVMKLYLHNSEGEPGVSAGTGWVQLGALRIRGGLIGLRPPKGILGITNGRLTLGARVLENRVPVPLEFAGPTRLELEGAEGKLLVTGNGATLALAGEPKFVENFPGSAH